MAGYVLFLFLVVPCVDLQSMIIAFHVHLLERRLLRVVSLQECPSDAFSHLFANRFLENANNANNNFAN